MGLSLQHTDQHAIHQSLNRPYRQLLTLHRPCSFKKTKKKGPYESTKLLASFWPMLTMAKWAGCNIVKPIGKKEAFLLVMQVRFNQTATIVNKSDGPVVTSPSFEGDSRCSSLGRCYVNSLGMGLPSLSPTENPRSNHNMQ